MAVSDIYPVYWNRLSVLVTIRCKPCSGAGFVLTSPGPDAKLDHDDIKYSRYPNHIQGLIPSIGYKAAPAPAITTIQHQVTGQLFFTKSGNISGKAFSFSGSIPFSEGAGSLCRDGTAGFSCGRAEEGGGCYFSGPHLPGTGKGSVPTVIVNCGLVFNNEMRR